MSYQQPALMDEDLSEYANIKTFSDLQSDNYQKYFGIPSITHRIFDKFHMCKKCCCGCSSETPSYYPGEDGDGCTRLLRWQLN